LVDGVTKLCKDDLSGNTSLDEQIETLRKIFTLMQSDVRIMLIKLADRLHNMRTIKFLSKEKQIIFARETKDVFAKIAHRLCLRDMRDELERLSFEVLEPEKMAKLKSFQAQNALCGEIVIDNFSKEFSSMNVEMEYEHKTLENLRMQLDAAGSAVTGIATLNVVLICKDIPSCYQALGVLHCNWPREFHSFDDYINNPQVCGYRGLHTTVILEDGTRVRCKLRTSEMQKYARNGVTTKCFDRKAMGVMNYLPWVENISSLSKDTETRSDEFWNSLQSDILGDSIVIHTSHGHAVQVPKDSTALDGAFYCFGDRATRIKNIKVDGEDVSFGFILEKGVSMDVELYSRSTVTREWLKHVNTGIAQAYIRSGLSAKPVATKIKEGKDLVQEIMIENKRGLIEEYASESFIEKLSAIGYSSLENSYIAIAEGKIDPMYLYKSLFESSLDKAKKNQLKKSVSTFRFHMNRGDKGGILRLASLYDENSSNLKKFRMWSLPFSNRLWFKISANLDEEEGNSLVKNIEKLGGKNILINTGFTLLKYLIGVTSLLFLWGIDPVIARLILIDYSVSPIDLVLIRFWTLALLCSAALIVKMLSGQMKEQVMISLKNIWLWLTSASLVVVAVSTYFALEHVLPANYTIPMTAAGMVLTSMQNINRLKVISAMWVIFAIGMYVLTSFSPGWTDGLSIIITALAVLAFTVFSIISERYKQLGHVSGRVLQYFFALSWICVILSLPLFALSNIFEMPLHVIALCVIFSVFISSLPYYLYYNALSHKQIDFVLRYSFLIIFASVGGQAVVFGMVTGATLLSAALVIIAAMFPLFIKERG